MTRTVPEQREDRTLRRETQTDRVLRHGAIALAEAFSLVSLYRALELGDQSSVPTCLATFALVLLPELCERLLRCRVRTDVYLLCVLYSLGSVLGDAWQFYARFPLWDKLLHTAGGVHFAMLGAYLPLLLDRDRKASLWLRAVFALCFSVALSALWEFYEFGMDRLFARDMQRDVFLSAIDSHLLGSGANAVGSIPQIDSVTVNGVVLEGYIDVGLTDTMHDMMVETLGALVYTVSFLLSRGENAALVPMVETEAA